MNGVPALASNLHPAATRLAQRPIHGSEVPSECFQPPRVVDVEILGDIEVGASAVQPWMKPQWASDGIQILIANPCSLSWCQPIYPSVGTG